jgi:DNA-binding response OmpR family regulator
MARILIIDTDENLRRQLEERLASDGHEVVGARDVREGGMLVRSRLYDLVVCETGSQKKDGFGLFEELREDNVRKMFPFTGEENDQVRDGSRSR